jgi:predicted CoA-binding protein
MIQRLSEYRLKDIFASTATIAVVGLSPKPDRPSNQVAAYLQQAGFAIIPVNPGQNRILGQTCYPDLLSVPVPVDVVDIFRRSDQIEPIVNDAITIQAKVIWMQQGIINQAAAVTAEQAGLTVVMDRCMKVDHFQLSHSAELL